MTQETQEKLFDLLYRLEEIFDYDKEELGKEIGEVINLLQKELLTN